MRQFYILFVLGFVLFLSPAPVNAQTTMTENPCCVVCPDGQKPCGDQCISKFAACTKEGCACTAAQNQEYVDKIQSEKNQSTNQLLLQLQQNMNNTTQIPENTCCVTCEGNLKACGDQCISKFAACTKKGCACNAEEGESKE